MEKINIVEWNINQRTNKKPIEAFVSIELTKAKPHIIFIVEYKEDIIFEDRIKRLGYKVYSTGKIQGKNEVLIAIRNDSTFTNIKKNIGELPASLDILSVGVKFKDRNICLIGTRIQVGAGDKGDYIDRGKQLKELVAYTKQIKSKFDSVIIAGDFNHGKIREEYNDNFLYKGYLQEPCNYQKIKMIFKEVDCQVCTPKENETFSWVGKVGENKNYYIKEDHIIISNNIIQNTISYEWDFVNNKNGYVDLKSDDYKSEFSGMPDHAKLFATISI